MGRTDSQRRHLAGRGRGRLVWAVVAAAVVGGGAAIALDGGTSGERGSQGERPQAAVAAATNDAGAVSDRALSSVVSIEVGGRGVTGSGFRVDVERIVVTSAQAVGHAETVTVLLRDGRRRTARVLGRAPGFDIAALELADDAGLPPMHSGSGLAELRVGDRVLAVGAPARVAAGVVTTLSRPVRMRAGTER